jgi:hypothetical protein
MPGFAAFGRLLLLPKGQEKGNIWTRSLGSDQPIQGASPAPTE